MMLMAPALAGCRIESVQLNANTVVGGGAVQGAVRIGPTCQRPFAEGLIRLQVLSNDVPLEAEVENSRELTDTIRFSALTRPVPTPTDTSLTARLIVPLPLQGSVVIASASTPLRLMPPLLGAISIPQSIPSTGVPQDGQITLVRPAPPGGAEVFLESSMPTLITVPASVIIPEGATTATFQATPIAKVSGLAPMVTITAFHAGTRRTATTILLPLLLTEISASPNPVVGGTPTEVTLRFNAVIRDPEVVSVIIGISRANANLFDRDTFTIRISPQPTMVRRMEPIRVILRGQELTAPIPLTILPPPEVIGPAPMMVTPPPVISPVAPGQLGAVRFFGMLPGL